MVEATIIKWTVQEGDYVKKGDALFEYENEKTTIECESAGDGIIHIVMQAGEVIKVGEVVALLAEDKAEYESMQKAGGEKADGVVPLAAEEKTIFTGQHAVAEGSRHIKASGLARAMAKNAAIDISAVFGTGPNGRILAKDISNCIKDSKKPASSADAEMEGGIVRTAITGLRKSIARNMHESLLQMAQSTVITEIDVTDIIEMKGKYLAKQEVLGTKITLNDLFVKATVKVLQKHPLLNATFDGSVISSYPYVNIGIAVGGESGLLVPVLKHAEKLTLTEISRSVKDLAYRAREGKLADGEQSGGTFTITNVGMYPIDFGTPIINPPQVGLIGFGRPSKKYVEYQGEFRGRTMMHLMLTFDHRVFDGLEVGRIMQDFKEFIENPELICA